MTQVFPTPAWTTYGPRPRPLGMGGYNGIPWGPGLDIQVQTYTGLDEMPDLVLNDQARTLADGTWSAPPYMGARTVTMQFLVSGSSVADVQNKLATLDMAWTPDSGYMPLWAFDGSRFLNAEVRKRAFIQWLGGKNQVRAQIQVQWYAKDPYWYGPEQQALVVASASSGGMTFPLTFPLVFGSVTPGGGPIYNPSLFTPVRIRIPGPSTHPFIGSDTLGLGLDLNIVIAADQYLDIDSDQRTVLLNGTASRNDLVTGQSQFFGLVYGANQLRLRSASNLPTETAIVTWNPRWR